MRRKTALAVAILLSLSILQFIDMDVLGGESQNMITVGTGKDHSTITAAVENASTGDTIVISNGTYVESLKIQKKITLKGEYHKGANIIGTTNPTISIEKDGYVVEDLNIEAKGSGATSVNISADNVTVERCVINKGSFGMVLYNVDNCTLRNNTFKEIKRPLKEIPEEAPETSAYPSQMDPIGHWSFEESGWSNDPDEVKDSSGNAHHGRLYGNAYPIPNGVRGKQAVFEGLSRIFLENHADFNITNGITMTAWIKTTSKKTYLSILDKHHHVPYSDPIVEKGYSLYLTEGKARISIYSNQSKRSAMGSHDLRDGKWHQIAGTYDGNRISVYVDGKIESSNNWSKPMTKSPVPLTMGERSEGWGGYMTFEGRMDEVSIYDTSLNSSAIEYLFGHYDIEDDNVNTTTAAFWNFDPKYANNTLVKDLSGNGNIGLITKGGLLSSDGIFKSSLLLNGGSSCMRVSDDGSLDIKEELSLTAWIKTSSQGYYQSVIDKHNYDGSKNNQTIESGYSLYLNAGKARLSVYSGENGHGNIRGSTDLRDGCWHHIVGTMDGENLRIFVDGKLEGTSPWTYKADENDRTLGIGRRIGGWGGYMPFVGYIDEVMILETNLSRESIESLYLGPSFSALKMVRSDDNLAENNTIMDNEVGGIHFENSDDNRVISNYLKDNGLGNIRIDGSSSSNSLNENVIAVSGNDNIPAIDNGRSTKWDLNGRGNYWSCWQTPDSDKNGIVDLAYVINGTANSKDDYPLTKVNYTKGAPTILTKDITTATVGIAYSVRYTASDPDTPLQNLTWSMSTNGGWISFGSDNYLNGTPGANDTGSCWVNITVEDGTYSDYTNFTINVKDNSSGNFSSGPVGLQFDEDTTTAPLFLSELFGRDDLSPEDVDVYATDGITATISESGEVLIVPDPDWSGTGEVVLTLKDEEQKTIRIPVEVLPVNDRPRINGFSLSGDPVEGCQLEITADVEDVDSEDLEYIWWIEGSGDHYTGNAYDIEKPAGDYVVYLTVLDDAGAETTRSYKVSIKEEEGTENDLPKEDDQGESSYLLYIAALVLVVFLMLLMVMSLVIWKRIGVRRKERRSIEEGLPPEDRESEPAPPFQVVTEGTLMEGEDDVIDSDDLGPGLQTAYKEGRISRETYEMIRDELEEMGD